MARLREHLEDAGAKGIRTVTPGYLMEVTAGDLDLEVVTGLARRAEQARAAGDWVAAAAGLTTALDLWRGDPLADVSSSLLRAAEVMRMFTHSPTSGRRRSPARGLVRLTMALSGAAIAGLALVPAASAVTAALFTRSARPR